MNRCKYIQPVHPRVRFGVELKEIYPPWYLHPALKNLIYLAEINIRNRQSARFDVEQLLGKGSNGEGSVKQRLDLKEHLISGKNILEVDVAPGIPVWLIRHFLGLLPTPIFPPKCDEHYWYNFSTRCYEQFIESIKKRSAFNELKDNVAFELAHLPGRNLTFLFELFELLRFLSMKSMADDVIDKHAALLLVRYFTPSLFVRPYRPGILTKTHKKYFAFILFNVHFWPELRIKIHDILTSSMNKNPGKFYYYPEVYDNKYSDNNIYLKDIGTQTESESEFDLFLNIQSSSEESEEIVINDNQKSEIKNKYLHENLESLLTLNSNEFKSSGSSSQEERNIISSTPKSKNKNALLENLSQKSIDAYYESIKKDTSKFLKNTSTQTDSPVKEQISSDITKPSVTRKFSVQINSRIKRRNPKKKTRKREFIILEIPHNKRRNGLNVITYKKSNQKTFKINKKTLKKNQKNKLKTNCSSVTYGWKIDSTLHNGDLIYDSYVGNCYEETPPRFKEKNIFSTPYRDVNLYLTPRQTPSVDIYKRITKFGWTYNQPNSQSTTTFRSPLEPYKLYYENDSKSINSLNSETPLTDSDSVKRKKGFSSFMKISSRFSFFKKFTSGKGDSRKTASCEDFTSTIKYEKISKSANSL